MTKKTRIIVGACVGILTGVAIVEAGAAFQASRPSGVMQAEIVAVQCDSRGKSCATFVDAGGLRLSSHGNYGPVGDTMLVVQGAVPNQRFFHMPTRSRMRRYRAGR